MPLTSFSTFSTFQLFQLQLSFAFPLFPFLKDNIFWRQDSIYLVPRLNLAHTEYQLHGSRKGIPKRKAYGGLLKNLGDLKSGHVLEQGEIINLGDEFGYISERKTTRDLFLQKHKSHEKRADGKYSKRRCEQCSYRHSDFFIS